jgi:hypothetical protein
MYHDFYENLGIFSAVFCGCIVCGKGKGSRNHWTRVLLRQHEGCEVESVTSMKDVYYHYSPVLLLVV